ncbi:MAG TPA: transposase [Tepidisphaeraceae bacterium]|jgi:transposase|nr:transposase [Tepidisphaeraceae bacterium]
MKRYAGQARLACGEVENCRRELKKLAADNPVIQSQSPAVGVATACVLWTALGDPREYHCAAAYRKAMGLNLAERSSGRYQGKLKISKRGSATARHWLHLASLRLIRRHAPVKAWYQQKKSRDAQAAMGAITAVTRRLAIALYAVAVNGEAFKPERLFPGPNRGPGEKGASAILTSSRRI